MRLHPLLTARWLRVFVVGAVASVLALASGIAFATESGGAPQVSTSAPDPISATVNVNGYGTSSSSTSNLSQLTICFDKEIQTINTGTDAEGQFLDETRFTGYGGYGGNASGTSPAGTIGRGTPGAVGKAGTVPGPGGSGGGTAGTPGTGSITGVTYSPDQTIQLPDEEGNGTSNGPFTFVAPSNGDTDYWGVASTSTQYTYTASAFSSSSNPDCVIVQITAPSGAPGLDLDQFSEVTLDQAAATGLASSTQYSTPASIPLTTSAGASEVVPRAGGSTGPKLLAGSSGGASNTLAYTFSEAIDPKAINPAYFCYISNSGTEYCGTSASISGSNSVIVTFAANINAAAYYEVYPGAVYSVSTGVPDPGTAAGNTVATVPTLQSATSVAGTPGSYDVTYDQCVTVNKAGNFAAVLQDNTIVTGATTSTVGTNCRMLRVSFGSVQNFSLFASKVVKIVDLGGAVKGTSTNSGTSALGEGDTTTPSYMVPGHTDGPDLTGFTVDTTQDAAYYYFDDQYGDLAGNASEPVPQSFGVIYKDGTNSLDQNLFGSTTFVAANEVKVQFPASAMGTSTNPVVGGVIGDAAPEDDECKTGKVSAPEGCDGSYAVQDYQNKGNISPLVSGIGGATTSTTTGTTSIATTTVTATTSTPPPGKGKLKLKRKKLKVKGGKVLIPLTCVTNIACTGKLSITYHLTTVHHHKVTALCTVPRSSTYRIRAHRSETVKLPLSKDCVQAIRRRRNHLSAKLTGKGLSKLVTLT